MLSLAATIVFVGLIYPSIVPGEEPVEDNYVWVGEEFKCENHYVMVKMYW